MEPTERETKRAGEREQVAGGDREREGGRARDRERGRETKALKNHRQLPYHKVGEHVRMTKSLGGTPT